MQHFHSQAITLSSTKDDRVYKYNGFGYQYFLHQSKRLGLYAKLRIGRKLFDAFRRTQERAPQVFTRQGQRVGCQPPRINDLCGLEILQGAGGWYTLTVLDEAMAHSITRFLARLNQWVLQCRRQTQSFVLNFRSNSLHTVYSVPLDHKGRVIQQSSVTHAYHPAKTFVPSSHVQHA